MGPKLPPHASATKRDHLLPALTTSASHSTDLLFSLFTPACKPCHHKFSCLLSHVRPATCYLPSVLFMGYKGPKIQSYQGHMGRVPFIAVYWAMRAICFCLLGHMGDKSSQSERPHGPLVHFYGPSRPLEELQFWRSHLGHGEHRVLKGLAIT